MAIVYDCNGFQFRKDLVFGWTFLGQNDSVPVSQMSIDHVMAIAKAEPFPIYVPFEMMEAVRARIRELTKPKSVVCIIEKEDMTDNEKNQQTNAALIFEMGLVSASRKIDQAQSKDRSQFLVAILENMKVSEEGNLISTLPYGSVSRKLDKDSGRSLIWKFTPTNGRGLGPQIFATIDDLADWVLRTIW